MKNLVSQMVLAPTAKPCLLHMAWGMISPKTTIPMVAPMTAKAPPPPVNMSRVTVRVLLTRTFPRRMEQRRKFPNLLIGIMSCNTKYNYVNTNFLS